MSYEPSALRVTVEFQYIPQQSARRLDERSVNVRASYRDSILVNMRSPKDSSTVIALPLTVTTSLGAGSLKPYSPADEAAGVPHGVETASRISARNGTSGFTNVLSVAFVCH